MFTGLLFSGISTTKPYAATFDMADSRSEVIPTILIHGGAGFVPSDEDKDTAKQYVDGVKIAVKAEYQALCGDSGSALNAVEAAVSAMENLPIFNAGRGSCLTVEGDIEMDAFIMEGKEFKTGAVTCVQCVQNPIQLARMVMEKTDHICFAGAGANKIAQKMGVPQVPTESLIVDRRKKMLAEYKTFMPAVKDEYKSPAVDRSAPEDHDTVGAVAIDAKGHIACATSTGGITGKLPGMVGDSPIIDPPCEVLVQKDITGTHAVKEHSNYWVIARDNGGVSTTGHGEAIARVTLARNVVYYIEQGLSAQAAAEKALHYMEDKVHSEGGLIALDKYGNIGRIPECSDQDRPALVAKMEKTFVDNLKYAADRLKKDNILGLIEPLNTKISVPGYFLDNQYKAVEFIKQVGSDNLKLQMDLFHVQVMHGNITNVMKELLPYVGHMQFAQYPSRHEPDFQGELNFDDIFSYIEKLGYDGWIGAEYKPSAATKDTLQWFQKHK